MPPKRQSASKIVKTTLIQENINEATTPIVETSNEENISAKIGKRKTNSKSGSGGKKKVKISESLITEDQELDNSENELNVEETDNLITKNQGNLVTLMRELQSNVDNMAQQHRIDLENQRMEFEETNSRLEDQLRRSQVTLNSFLTRNDFNQIHIPNTGSFF